MVPLSALGLFLNAPPLPPAVPQPSSPLVLPCYEAYAEMLAACPLMPAHPSDATMQMVAKASAYGSYCGSSACNTALRNASQTCDRHTAENTCAPESALTSVDAHQQAAEAMLAYCSGCNYALKIVAGECPDNPSATIGEAFAEISTTRACGHSVCNAALHDVLTMCPSASASFAHSHLRSCAEALPSPAQALADARELRANWLRLASVVYEAYNANFSAACLPTQEPTAAGCEASPLPPPRSEAPGSATLCVQPVTTFRGIAFDNEDTCKDHCNSLPPCTHCSRGINGDCNGGVNFTAGTCDDSFTFATYPTCCQDWLQCAAITPGYANCVTSEECDDACDTCPEECSTCGSHTDDGLNCANSYETKVDRWYSCPDGVLGWPSEDEIEQCDAPRGEANAARGTAFNKSLAASMEWPAGERPLNWEAQAMYTNLGGCRGSESFSDCEERLAGTPLAPMRNRILTLCANPYRPPPLAAIHPSADSATALCPSRPSALSAPHRPLPITALCFCFLAALLHTQAPPRPHGRTAATACMVHFAVDAAHAQDRHALRTPPPSPFEASPASN